MNLEALMLFGWAVDGCGLCWGRSGNATHDRVRVLRIYGKSEIDSVVELGGVHPLSSRWEMTISTGALDGKSVYILPK
jgi:hypothetical protein